MNLNLREPLLLTAFIVGCATVAAMEEPALLKTGSSGLHFTSEPSESEIFKARVFDEPLLPFGGKPAAAENKALADALVSYASRTNLDDFSSLNDFLARYPDSKWRDSLLLHLGVEYYNQGYFSRALDAWRRGWDGCGALDEASSKPSATGCWANWPGCTPSSGAGTNCSTSSHPSRTGAWTVLPPN